MNRAWVSVIRLFDSPGEVFSYVVEKPALLPPYAAGAAFGAIATAASLPVTLKFIEAEFSSRGMGLGAFTTNWVVIGGIIGALFGPLLMGFVTAVLVFGILWVGGQAVTLRSTLAVVGYARLPLSIGVLMNSLLIRNAASFEQVKQVSLSAAALAPVSASPLTRALLSTLAPFDLWYFMLLVVGVAALTRRAGSKVWWVAAMFYGLNLLMAMLGSGMAMVQLR